MVVVIAWGRGGWIRVMGPFDEDEAAVVRDHYESDPYWTKVTVEELQPADVK